MKTPEEVWGLREIVVGDIREVMGFLKVLCEAEGDDRAGESGNPNGRMGEEGKRKEGRKQGERREKKGYSDSKKILKSEEDGNKCDV